MGKKGTNTSSTSVGLQRVRRIKKYLEQEGYMVDGPGYAPLFFRGRMRIAHRDYFGVFDLLTASPTEHIRGHQVCSINNKSRNAKKILDAGLSGFIWAFRSDKEVSVFFVSPTDGIQHEKDVVL